MDDHGADAPVDKTFSRSDWQITAVERRQYLPSLADLLDRLTIVILKQVNIPEHRDAYDKERKAIEHDIALLGGDAKSMAAIAILMLSNHTIWINESKARAGGSEQDKLLKFTHSINGVRNHAKNVIAVAYGGRVDLKVDSLAADLPPEFGNWDIL